MTSPLRLLAIALIALSAGAAPSASAQTCAPRGAAPRTAAPRTAAPRAAAPRTAAPAAMPATEVYSDARFAALQRQGALVLIDVHAPWCPTCAQQQTLLAAYRAAHPAAPLHVLRVDFDSQKDAVRRFRAPRQSTLVLYRGTERVWFSVAETRRDVVFAALDGAMTGR